MKNPMSWKILSLGCLLLVLVFMPKLISEFSLNLFITMLIYSLFAIAYNILLGQGGLLSFGHSAFFGMGAYGAILSYKHLGFSLLTGILAGGVCSVLLGLVFGVFVSRLQGLPFALLSMAFNMVIFGVAEKWRSLTNGEDGLAVQRPDLFLPGIGRIDMFPTVNFYYFVLFVVVVCIAYCWFFTKTPLGRLNVCIRENQERAGFIGYDTYRTKFLIYLVCAFFSGISGALSSSFQEFVSTLMINLDKSADILIMTFIGGRNIFWGPIAGVCFLTYFNDVVSSFTSHWAIIQGAIFIALVMYEPEGISHILLRINAWTYERLKSKKG